MKEQETFFEAEKNLPFSIFLYSQTPSEWHCHKFIELLYCIRGRYDIMVNGETYPCESGDFVIIHTMEPHLTRPVDDKGELLCVQFDLSVMDNTYSTLYESQFLLPFIRGKVPFKKYIRTQRGTMLESILSEILIEYQNKKPGYQMCIRGNFFRLFTYLIRNQVISVVEKEVDSEDVERIRPVVEFLEDDEVSELSVSEAASIACMSYYHFCRLFKKVTGKTFVEYQNFVRIKKAEKLLTTTTKSITDIAFEVGFGSAAYFNRIFKRETNQSPVSYRNNMKL